MEASQNHLRHPIMDPSGPHRLVTSVTHRHDAETRHTFEAREFFGKLRRRYGPGGVTDKVDPATHLPSQQVEPDISYKPVVV
jgi:hypothetical protein